MTLPFHCGRVGFVLLLVAPVGPNKIHFAALVGDDTAPLFKGLIQPLLTGDFPPLLLPGDLDPLGLVAAAVSAFTAVHVADSVALALPLVASATVDQSSTSTFKSLISAPLNLMYSYTSSLGGTNLSHLRSSVPNDRTFFNHIV